MGIKGKNRQTGRIVPLSDSDCRAFGKRKERAPWTRKKAELIHAAEEERDAREVGTLTCRDKESGQLPGVEKAC